MKCKVFFILLLLTISKCMAVGKPDTLTLSLQDAIELAHRQSPSVQSARNAFLSAYWNYRYYLANYLPSVTLTSSPYINKEMNKITQSDGTAMFIRQDQFGADLTLKINQNISWTGGSFFVKSAINRLDELQNHTRAYSSQPLLIGYEQSLFGYNSFKWDKKIAPRRYREAKKQYAETLELISATTCNHFFSLASAQTELDLARQNFASADTLYHMAQGRYQIGTITENEMLQLEINRLNEETNVMDAEITLKEVSQSISSFLGLEETPQLSLIMPDSVPQFEVSVPTAMELALDNSPDPEYYRRIIKESESNLAYAKANARLKADLYVQFGLSQTGLDIGQSFSNLMHQEYASVSLSLPILDWGRGRGKVKVAKSQLELTRTQAEQGMNDFTRNVEKLVLQFNMQARKVRIAALTDRRATQRHTVAKHLYVMGRSSILDLMSAVSEKNYAKRNFITTLRTYWSLYYTLRSITAYDFERNLPLTEELPLN
ncbi:MAG: TolC family protein [Muribaculaceae bacterium]|nr:TolC family protein [Muribaculaceae bacterium]